MDLIVARQALLVHSPDVDDFVSALRDGKLNPEQIRSEIRATGYEPTICIINPKVPNMNHGQRRWCLDQVKKVRCGVFEEVWFFGTLINIYHLTLLEEAPTNVIVWNYSLPRSSLDLYLQLFTKAKRA